MGTHIDSAAQQWLRPSGLWLSAIAYGRIVAGTVGPILL